MAKKLVADVIMTAKEIGYQKMRLGTLPRHYAALGLYRSLGFKVVNTAQNAAEVAGEDFEAARLDTAVPALKAEVPVE